MRLGRRMAEDGPTAKADALLGCAVTSQKGRACCVLGVVPRRGQLGAAIPGTRLAGLGADWARPITILLMEHMGERVQVFLTQYFVCTCLEGCIVKTKKKILKES